jgi:hypothetical protein
LAGLSRIPLRVLLPCLAVSLVAIAAVTFGLAGVSGIRGHLLRPVTVPGAGTSGRWRVVLEAVHYQPQRIPYVYGPDNYRQREPRLTDVDRMMRRVADEAARMETLMADKLDLPPA